MPDDTQLSLIYGKLTVRRSYYDPKTRHRMCECECSCIDHTVIVVRESDLRRGITSSCGCIGTKHGGTYSRTWQSWQAMRRRCYDPNYASYPDYGGRGVRVWPAWNDVEGGYREFVKDMGERPKGMTLDRIDPRGHYIPSNCKWSTDLEQAHNKRRLWDRRASEEDASEQGYWDEQERLAAESQSEK